MTYFLNRLLDAKPEVPFREGKKQQKAINMRKIQLAIMAASLAVTMSASASLTIDYSVGGWGPVSFPVIPNDPVWPGDTLEMSAYSGSGLSLPDNKVVTAPINTSFSP